MSDLANGPLRCLLVTPEGQLADCGAQFIVLTAHDGQYGILPGRAPLVCKLGIGLLRADHKSGGSMAWLVAGGFAEVANDTVTVITTQAMSADDIDIGQVDNELKEAVTLACSTPQQRQQRDRMVELARAKRAVRFSYARGVSGKQS